MYAVPTPSEMFSDVAHNSTAVAEKFEAYKALLADSLQRSDSGELAFQEKAGIVRTPDAQRLSERVATITKSLSAEQTAGLQGELDAIKSSLADLSKDWTLTNPNAQSLAPVDLEAPAKLMVPRETPIRNSLTRGKGQGTGRQFKRILGWSNSGTGGIPDQMAFMNSESVSTAFGPISLRRGAKINYASDSKTVAYVEQGLSDMVTTKAQFAGQGFQDIRSLSQTALLWATLGAEERGLLFARGASGNGYAGPVAAPVISIATSASGGAVATGTYFAKVTARAGGGESVVSNEVNTGALTGSTNQFTVTVATEPTGALGYNLYIGTSSNAETFVTSFVGNTVTILATPAVGGAAMPGADSTVNANAYDGFLTVQSDPNQSGYVKRVNAKIYDPTTPANSKGDGPFQDAFLSMYGANAVSGADRRLANPDEVWVDGSIRRGLGDWVQSAAGGAAAYRISMTTDVATGGMTVGSVVSGVQNKVTGKMVDLNVHPYMYQGCSLIRSRALPMPDSEVSATSEVINVQDYMAMQWPQIQFTYDQSTYMFGTLVHYAPGWSGLLIGLQ